MDEKPTPEEILNMRSFKMGLFTLYWEKFQTFYVHVMPHPELIIGNRGLVGEERESGIILVFGPRAVKDIRYREKDLFCELQFGYNWEEVFIPWDAIFRIYDKSQMSLVQMRILSTIDIDDSRFQTGSKKPGQKKVSIDSGEESDKGKVIHIDFGGKKD